MPTISQRTTVIIVIVSDMTGIIDNNLNYYIH